MLSLGRPANPAPTSQPGAASAPAVRLPVLREPPNPLVDGQMWIDASDGQIRVVVDGQVRAWSPRPGSSSCRT